jgi:hypothetical protein
MDFWIFIIVCVAIIVSDTLNDKELMEKLNEVEE